MKAKQKPASWQVGQLLNIIVQEGSKEILQEVWQQQLRKQGKASLTAEDPWIHLRPHQATSAAFQQVEGKMLQSREQKSWEKILRFQVSIPQEVSREKIIREKMKILISIQKIIVSPHQQEQKEGPGGQKLQAKKPPPPILRLSNQAQEPYLNFSLFTFNPPPYYSLLSYIFKLSKLVI
jgi:hypothetical protein